MRQLQLIELIQVSGGGLHFNQKGPLLFIYVTGDSHFYNTGNFLGMTASISLFADRAEDIMGNVLLSGNDECFYDGYTIYSNIIPNGSMYTFYHGIPA